MSIELEKIREIAFQAHLGQFRPGGFTPYFTHVEAVADTFDEDQRGLKAVAYLHDVLEDTPLTAQALLGLGVAPWVVLAVEAITKRENEAYEVYLVRVKANHMARKVKIADILHNLSCEPSKKQVKKYVQALKFLLEPL